MQAFQPKTNDSKYPSGYLEGLYQAYDQYDTALRKLANTPPSEASSEGKKLDLMEQDLLTNQTQLLEIVASLKASNLREMREVLNLWHKIAIEEVSPSDISQADELVLVVYNYLSAIETHSRVTPQMI